MKIRNTRRNPALDTPIKYNSGASKPLLNYYITNDYFSRSVGKMRDLFVETPPISTHMVAFIVNGFNSTTTGGGGGRSAIYVFTDAGRMDQVKYVSGEAPKLLAAMERFTEMQYELPKLDLIAIPDFKSDAMGNWGMSTYRYDFIECIF